jgi:transposase
MGKRRGRTAYTDDFRREAVRLATRDPEHVARIARELDVHPDTLKSWLRRAAGSTGPIVPATQVVTLEEENRQLRRENERLKEEREILKKATVFFARERQ